MSRHLVRNIGMVARCTNRYREKFLEGTGMNGPQVTYVLEICRSPGIAQDQLAQRLHVNPSTVTRQLGALEENGYITRQRSQDDRRVVEVYPTDKMNEMLPRVRGIFADWREILAQGLTEAELETLAELMQRLARNAEDALA